MDRSKSIYQNSFILLIGMIACGLLSVWLGKDLCWDVANYHLYNPYAFLNARYTVDFWPSSFIHQYINPTIDLLTYYLIASDHPIFAEFMMGAIHGVNFFIAYLIARCFTKSNYVSLFLALCGLYGPTVWPGIGSFQNDNLISVFVLLVVYLQIQTISAYSESKILPKKILLMAGLILGLSVGLKLTAGIYVFGIVVATLLLPIQLKAKIQWMFWVGISAAIGLLITSGHWMYFLWQHYHNPVFPFLNNIFHSPDFPGTNWRDKRFLPDGILQNLFYPFYFSFDGRIADEPFLDLRFLFCYLLFFIAALTYFLRKNAKKDLTNWAIQWFYLFFIISYVIWQSYFSIARYLAPLEILAPLVIFLLFKFIVENSTLRLLLLSVTFYTLIFFMQPTQMIRAPWYKGDFLNVSLPASFLHQPAVVLMPYPAYAVELNPRPQAYLIPYFPGNWRFIGVPFSHEKYMATDKQTLEKIKQRFSSEKKFYLIAPEDSLSEMYKAVRQFGLEKTGKCESISSDRVKASHTKVIMCLLKK